ncbi:MAG: hypothetical protein AMJ43_04080 [Coxiella sp. DG_40]|nr:MAG: hypothetical protein AMJ43_04080 [Coxiella sp. DG_40]
MPISLDKINLSCIDKGLLPGWLGEMAYGVSEATETPLELPAMMALAVLSTCCQSKFIVEVEEGYCEPVNIWTIAALESANRKSSVVKILTSPLVEWEQEQAEIIKPEINRAASRKKTVESTIIRLRKKAATASGDNFSKLQNDIEELEQSIPEIPKIPRLWAQDITPENLGITMAKHGDKLAIISPEGGIVEMMAGRYSGGIPNIDIYLHGHAGDSLRVDRNNRPPVFMNHPALTLGLAPQPDVLRSLAARKEFDTRGLLARFLYVLPKSNLGERKLISKPIPENVKQKYTASLKKLLAIDNDNIFKLKLSFEANRRWKDYAKAVETQLKDGGKFEHIKSWAGKLPGAVIRIAGLFHCVNFADYADVFGGNTKSLLIGDISIIKAIDLAKILSEQALAAFDLMQADQNLNGARKVLNWIKTKNISDFSVKECFDSLRTFKRVKHLMPALEILEEHNYIFKQENETLFAGRPSNIFRVNPHLGADEK